MTLADQGRPVVGRDARQGKFDERGRVGTRRAELPAESSMGYRFATRTQNGMRYVPPDASVTKTSPL